MSEKWLIEPLRGILVRVERPEVPAAGTLYRQIGVRLCGEGAYEREVIDGSQTRYATLSRVVADDIVVNKIWARSGSVAVVPAHLSGCHVSSEFPTFAPRRDKLDPRWFHWLTKTRSFWQQCDEKSRGTSGKNRIRPDQFLEVAVLLPPLPEQRRIVARIQELAARIEEARVLQRQAATEADAVVASRTSEVLDRLTSGTRRPIQTLGKDGGNPIQIGPFGAQLHKSDFVEHGVPVLNVGNVWPDGLRLDSLDHLTEEKAAALSRYKVKEGDLLFARSGATLGKVCLVPGRCDAWLMTGHLFRVRFDERQVLNRFAFCVLRSSTQVQEQVFGQVRGATRPGYNTGLLGAVELPIPSLAEQRRMVDELDALQAKVDALKRLQAETAAELDALLPAILDRAFKGDL